MKVITQSLRDGATTLVEVPAPRVGPGAVRIRSTRSLLSTGTERMLVEFGRGNYLEKALQQPERVWEVLDKVRTDGIGPTYESVTSKLDQPLPLGYCNVGVVDEVGPGVDDLDVGDRVASNGGHAELVCVPRNLVAKIPDSVEDEAASFVVLSSIALQGLRLAAPTLGERFVVTGLGLIGLLAVQLLRANGCKVLGIDSDASRLDLARAAGAEVVDLSAGEDPESHAVAFSGGRGVDGVLICASTQSSEPVRQAAHMCRKRGRIVLVGVTGLELSRQDFYEKELSFQVSCSYGPGRYDPAYEEGGADYPFGFVRWTEGRNFEAVLDLLERGALDPAPLISHRFPFERAPDAYDLIVSGASSLGIVLEFDGGSAAPERTVSLELNDPAPAPIGAASGAPLRVNFLGAGNHALRALLPAFRSADCEFGTIVSRAGLSGSVYGKRYGFSAATTDADTVFAGDQHQPAAVVVATRHDSHAGYVLQGLEAGRHLFVEKPLCLNLDEFEKIEAALASRRDALRLLVGFNRRFAPLVEDMQKALTSVPGPRSIVITVNAGAVPPDHWAQDPVAGGGRIIGEACHFVDLARFLAGARITDHHAVFADTRCRDSASINLAFANGSIATVHYLAEGHRSFPKERIEVFVAGRILRLDNFRKLQGFGWPKRVSRRNWRQDKGHDACVAAFVNAVRGGSSVPDPIPLEEILEVTRTTIEIADSC